MHFEPNSGHLQECLGLLDDLDGLAIPPDQALITDFKKLFNQTYGDQR
jgi:hypothetical protein